MGTVEFKGWLRWCGGVQSRNHIKSSYSYGWFRLCWREVFFWTICFLPLTFLEWRSYQRCNKLVSLYLGYQTFLKEILVIFFNNFYKSMPIWLRRDNVYSWQCPNQNDQKHEYVYFYASNFEKIRNLHVLQLKTWKILAKGNSFNPATRECDLCLKEKFCIIFQPEGASLNDTSELFATCRHRLIRSWRTFNPPFQSSKTSQ